MTFQAELNKVVLSFIDKIAVQFNLDKKSLYSVWNEGEKQATVPMSEINTELSVERLSKSTVPELKAFCKANNLKCSGKKEELISRLLDKIQEKASVELPKTNSNLTVKEQKKEMVSTVLAKKKQPENIAIHKNAFGKFEHTATRLVFNPDTKTVIGVQNPNGNVDNLTDDDIENCKQFNFKYNIPFNLDENEKLADVKVDELEDNLSKFVEEDAEDVEDEEDTIEEEDEIPIED